MKSRIFSGVKPSGDLHIGNYLGAIQQWVEMQEKFETVFCLVDLHAITVPQDPALLKKRTLDIAKTYLASGIDSKQSIIFSQSHVSEHTELCWILNTVTRMGDLEKMTQFKDKSFREGAERAGVGLFDYPVLMAADILLYDTAIVPVGDDQVQHVELARTLARRFNQRFGEVFMVPEVQVRKEGARIMGLDNPTKKMSKSAASEYNFVALLDDPELARKKIMKAVTDSGTEVLYSDTKPALMNLLNIFSLLGNVSIGELVKRYQGKGYADFKRDLAETVADFLVDFQRKFHALSDEETLRILREGANRARAIASEKMNIVRERVGFLW